MGSTPILATKEEAVLKLGSLFCFMKYTVYILYSEKYDKHYTGFTSDMEIRIQSHNIFGKGWTARYRPWKIIYTKEFNSKSDAMKFELWLKSGIGRDFIKSLNH